MLQAGISTGKHGTTSVACMNHSPCYTVTALLYVLTTFDSAPSKRHYHHNGKACAEWKRSYLATLLTEAHCILKSGFESSSQAARQCKRCVSQSKLERAMQAGCCPVGLVPTYKMKHVLVCEHTRPMITRTQLHRITRQHT